MDLRNLAWVFKGTLVVTLLYAIACLVIWMLLGSQKGWISLCISGATGLMFSQYMPKITEWSNAITTNIVTVFMKEKATRMGGRSYAAISCLAKAISTESPS